MTGVTWFLKTYSTECSGMSAGDALDERPLPRETGAQCPGCGLVVEAWRLVDLRDAPEEAAAALQLGAHRDRWRCDGCLARFERDGVAVPDPSAAGRTRPFREDLCQEWQGAPAALIERSRDVLDLRDLRRAARRRDGVFREEEFRREPEAATLIARIEARGKYKENRR